MAAMASRSGPPSPSSLHYLSSLLDSPSHSLPYDYSVRSQLAQQLAASVQEFSGLQVKPEIFTHNDGRTVNLLQLQGTIPMFYQGSKYNIPINLWVLEGFPKMSPLIFVTPTRDMVIKPQHSFVDLSGQVNLPYLRDWNFQKSNVVELLRQCSSMFGRNPPLFSRAAMFTPSPSLSPSLSLSLRSPAISQSSSNNSFGSDRKKNSENDPEEIFKRNVIASLTERFQQDMSRQIRDLQQDIDQEMNTQILLKSKAEAIDKGLQTLILEKELLEYQLQVLLTNTDVLEEWLRKNDKGKLEFEIDTVFQPTDMWSKQILETTSVDLTIEDILYSLEKAVQGDDNERIVFSIDSYLKNIRVLSREQFENRALGMKVRAQQIL